MHDYPCIMSETLQPREVRDVEELRALAHPMRQRILRRLREAGPATSTTLGRDLGENSGIMSYHLRLLAEHDFVREVAGRGQGRERWWEVSPEPVWIPREGLGIEAQAEVSGLQPSSLARGPGGLPAGSAPPERRWASGAAGPGPCRRARLTLTREEAGRLIADQQELIGRYRGTPPTPRPAPAPWCSGSWPIPSHPRAATLRARTLTARASPQRRTTRTTSQSAGTAVRKQISQAQRATPEHLRSLLTAMLTGRLH